MNLPTPSASPVPSAASGAEEGLSPRRFLLLLSATVLALFPKLALGINTLFYRDFGALGYPFAVFQRDSFFRGELPLWSPYSHCGTPFMAQWGLWYPPYLAALLLPLPWSANLLALLHLVWAGYGMYWLTRRWGVGAFAAGVAGFAYAFNGVMLSCFTYSNYISSLSWLPWVVGCVVAAWKHGGRWIPLAAAASAMQVLTATPEITLLSWVFIGALWLSALWSREADFRSSLLRTTAIVALAAGITMVQMLPFYDLLSHSQRDRNYGGTVWSMPGWGWANLFVPLFHSYQSPQGPWFQKGQEFMNSYYLGAGMMALAMAGVWISKAKFRFVFAGMAVLCWILALGPDGYLFSWVLRVFPWIGIARFPVKFTIITTFLVPVLAAWAIEQLTAAGNTPARRRLFAVAGCTLALMAAFLAFAGRYPLPNDNWSFTAWNTLLRVVLMLAFLAGILWQVRAAAGIPRFVAQIAVLILLPLDAGTHSPNLVPTLPASALAPGMWEASGKPAPPKLGEGRLMISPAAERRLMWNSVPDHGVNFTGKRLAEWYNLNLVDRIPKVTGAMTLRPGNFDLVERYLYYTEGVSYGTGIMDFLSVTWISDPQNPVDWVPRTNALPVMTAGQRPVFTSQEDALRRMTASDYDPRDVVYLSESARTQVASTNRTSCALHNVRHSSQVIEADTESAETSLVVLSQTYYHHWRAFVDDQPVEILLANAAFQAVQVPPGKHHLKLVYRDPNFVAGGIVTLLSLVACGLIWFRNPSGKGR